MTLTFFLAAAFLMSIALMACSAWLISVYAYILTLTLLAVGLMGFLVGGKANVDDIMIVAFDVLVFGFFFYYVTVQWLMQRNASEITDRDEFRETMESEGRFRGLAQFVYHLPGPLLGGATGLAVIGTWLY
ncbi:MAG: hypothetical protein LH481_13620 [Burkholderiales bacterium]|nr:hypothetical protein [Burkholderiales bacterium]